MAAAKVASPKFSPAQAQALYDKAHAAGHAAAEAHSPRPMVVVEHENPFDDNSPIKKIYEPILAGVCGFAWINIRPGNSSFASWCRKQGRGHKSYYGGWDVWVSGYGQSYEKKLAYAKAFAKVLNEAGIKAYPGGRLD
jgi:hypothetical protein